jgi:hypothetical protein
MLTRISFTFEILKDDNDDYDNDYNDDDYIMSIKEATTPCAPSISPLLGLIKLVWYFDCTYYTTERRITRQV